MGFLLLLSAPLLLCSEPLTVYTVNYPLQYFTQRIAGDHARVVFPAPADVDPAFWMPDRKTIGDYQRADLIVLNGAAYAGWVSKVSLPRLHQVDTSKAFKADWMLWEKQPLPEIAQQLDSMGIGIAVFDPCANRPANGDFLSVMQQNIANLRRAYTN